MKNYIKGIITGIIIGAAVCSTSVFASDNISVILDGEKIAFDVQPQIIEERTFVPMRAVFEAFDMTVDWNGETQTVTANRDNNSITMTIGTDTFYHNGEAIELDVPAQIVGDRTLVPVRAISESLDYTVKWDGDLRRVTIISSEDKVLGTATVDGMYCLLDRVPIEYVNVGGFTYLSVNELDSYGFDVLEKDGDIYITRNKNELPVLTDKFIDKFIGNRIKTEWVNNDHRFMSIVAIPNKDKTFDIFNTESNVFLDGEKTNSYNVGGEMYMQADELQKYGTVEWIDRETVKNAHNGMSNVQNGLYPNTLLITTFDRDMEYKNNFVTFPKNYTGIANYYHSEFHGSYAGLCEFKDGKANGMGYRITFYQDYPPTLYTAGEFENGELKNGIIIGDLDNDLVWDEMTVHSNYLIVYKVENFEKTQLYPKEDIQ